MILAVIISQIPMPDSQAEIAKEMTAQNPDDESVHTVTFSMNGGNYDGNYNGYSFQNKTPVLVIDDGDAIKSFPDEKYASYSGYKTEKNVWYTDAECLQEYEKDRQITESITLYKKWYRITSDGNTLSDKGFHVSADGTVLYQYDGDDKHVQIPDTVTTIAEGAFKDLANARGITLPPNIRRIDDNAFSGVKDGSIIYIYDTNTADSKKYAKQLADAYEQMVYSEYLDIEAVEEIAGIDYEDISLNEEESSASESSEEEQSKSEESSSDTESSKTEQSSSEEESSQVEQSSSEEGSKAEESSVEVESSEAQESSVEVESSEEEESSSVIIIEPDKKYTVTFDTGISGVDGEKREVLSGRTISELVTVNGNQPQILKKGSYQIEKDDGKQEITYTFQGWYHDKEYTKEWNFANDIIEEDTTIYAKWDKEARAYFYVTFSAEGAQNVPEKQKLYEDENLKKPSPNPSISNKIFKGWFTGAADSAEEFTSWNKPVTKDLTLYARFEEKSYTVVFHMNGGGFTGSYNGTSYTDAASLKTKITVGKGISSSGYPESETSASFKYSSYQTDSNWYTDKECLAAYAKKDTNGNDTVLGGDLTLYKKWYYTSSGFTMNASGNVLYKYSGSLADVTIPGSVTVIGKDAFSNVTGISSITLPDNISDVRSNAFSGITNSSKDITITGKSENAKNVAKGLANQYTHLVYRDSQTTDTTNSNSNVNVVKSGDIKLGATISGSTGKTTAAQTTTNATQATGSITLGTDTGSMGSSAVPATGGTVTGGTAAANQTISSEQGVPGASSAVAGARTVQKQNATSASAPRSSEHIKDATPKTGDPTQYRMLIVCAMFSVGALIVLTGNGKKKRFSAS